MVEILQLTVFCWVGNKGTLRAGDLQWMTAGRGIVHSEMPGWERARGLQLWVNLAREDKMVEPAYQELRAAQIPTITHQGVTVRVIAGKIYLVLLTSEDCIGVRPRHLPPPVKLSLAVSRLPLVRSEHL